MGLLPADTVVTVETKWFPPLRVPLSEEGGAPGPIVRLLKPKVTITVKGQVIVTAAPAGEPYPSEWPKAKIALAVAVGLVVFSILRIIR